MNENQAVGAWLVIDYGMENRSTTICTGAVAAVAACQLESAMLRCRFHQSGKTSSGGKCKMICLEFPLVRSKMLGRRPCSMLFLRRTASS